MYGFWGVLQTFSVLFITLETPIVFLVALFLLSFVIFIPHVHLGISILIFIRVDVTPLYNCLHGVIVLICGLLVVKDRTHLLWWITFFWWWLFLVFIADVRISQLYLVIICCSGCFYMVFWRRWCQFIWVVALLGEYQWEETEVLVCLLEVHLDTLGGFLVVLFSLLKDLLLCQSA